MDDLTVHETTSDRQAAGSSGLLAGRTASVALGIGLGTSLGLVAGMLLGKTRGEAQGLAKGIEIGRVEALSTVPEARTWRQLWRRAQA